MTLKSLNTCIRNTYSGYNSIKCCNIDLDKRRLYFEDSKDINKSNCSNSILNDIRSLLYHKYFNLVWNYLLHIGYHAIDFEKKGPIYKLS
jgi:hypothetical protein